MLCGTSDRQSLWMFRERLLSPQHTRQHSRCFLLVCQADPLNRWQGQIWPSGPQCPRRGPEETRLAPTSLDSILAVRLDPFYSLFAGGKGRLRQPTVRFFPRHRQSGGTMGCVKRTAKSWHSLWHKMGAVPNHMAQNPSNGMPCE